MLLIIVGFIIGTLISACCLWVGMKLTDVDGDFVTMLIIAAVSSVLGLFPSVGGWLGGIAMLILICKWVDAPLWPDAVLLVVVANVVQIFAGAALLGMLAGLL